MRGHESPMDFEYTSKKENIPWSSSPYKQQTSAGDLFTIVKKQGVFQFNPPSKPISRENAEGLLDALSLGRGNPFLASEKEKRIPKEKEPRDIKDVRRRVSRNHSPTQSHKPKTQETPSQTKRGAEESPRQKRMRPMTNDQDYSRLPYIIGG